jgi:hypothetical protein
MSLSLLWMTIEPGHDETRLMLTAGGTGPVLRARLPPVPRQAGSLGALLEALSGWYGAPLTAVVDADARESALHPNRWSQLLGEIDSELVQVEWVVAPTTAERDRFLGETGGDFRAARRRLTFAATGIK